MASLEKLVVQLRQKKQESTKLRKKAEKQLKEARSAQRRSSSGLVTIDRKIESERENISDILAVLTQKTSQLESIKRLVAAAQERLGREKDAMEQARQEIEFADSPEEKQNAEARLRSLGNHVAELELEIRNRQKTAKKISAEAESISDIKSKISSNIQKQTKLKPSLRETMVASHKAAEKFVKEVERRLKSEASTQKTLDEASAKLKELLAKRKAVKRKKPKDRKSKRLNSSHSQSS